MTRRPFFVGVLFVAVVVVTALAIQTEFDAQKQSAPPHQVRPVAAPGPLPLVAVGGESVELEVAAIGAWVDGVARAEWIEGVERAEAEMAAQARARDLRQPVPRTSTGTPGSCDGIDWAIPVELVVRESGCRFDAQSPPSFCGGAGCVGAYQFDARHWDAGSGWGGCADLGDWTVPEHQHECARRLSRDGTYLAPWGG